MKVVLDTNILVSALLIRDSIPARILRAVWDGQLQLQLQLQSSAPLQKELLRVLEYPKIRKRLLAASIDIHQYLELLPFFVTEVVPDKASAPVPRDPADRMVLATLIAGSADWLITGDEDLLVLADQFPILTPTAFVERFLR